MGPERDLARHKCIVRHSAQFMMYNSVLLIKLILLIFRKDMSMLQAHLCPFLLTRRPLGSAAKQQPFALGEGGCFGTTVLSETTGPIFKSQRVFESSAN